MQRSLTGIGMTSQRTRARMVERLREQGIKDEVVLNAMLEVPRHLFVDEALASRAYDDVSLPINFSQTISRPYTVARMIEVLRAAGPLKRVLEIGTGCGYQAAVLAEIFPNIYTVERIQSLYVRARKKLMDLQVDNVTIRYADGANGMPDAAPFDGIILAAAAPTLPAALRDQLTPNGRMVLPLGGQDQWLYLVQRDASGFRESKLEPVKFVPLLAGRATD